MRILVTGAAGFIGTHLCRELQEHGHTVGLYDIAHGLDAADPERLRAALSGGAGYDLCVHLAAKVGRLFGEDDVKRTIADNAGMTAVVAQACGDLGIPLVYASTSEVYGDVGSRTAVEEIRRPAWHQVEAGAQLPHNLYGLSKRWGEEVCRLYAPDNLTIWRISMPYGPGLPAGRGRAAIINFLYNALHRQPITVHRDSERSWCWIGDTVRAMRLTIEQGKTGAWNIGRDDNATSMLDVAQRACRLTGAPESLIELVDAPARQTVVKRLSTEKIRGLGWAPTVDLDEGMWRTLQWVKQQVKQQPAPGAQALAA